MTARLRRRVAELKRTVLVALVDEARAGAPSPSSAWGALVTSVRRVVVALPDPVLLVLLVGGIGGATTAAIRTVVSWAVSWAVALVGCPLPLAHIVGRVVAKFLLRRMDRLVEFAERVKKVGLVLAVVLGSAAAPDVEDSARDMAKDRLFSDLEDRLNDIFGCTERDEPSPVADDDVAAEPRGPRTPDAPEDVDQSRTRSNDQNLWMVPGEVTRMSAPSRG
jgi:hypothetical protein